MPIVNPQTHEETKTRRQPPFNVILENDDHHSQVFVVGVLRKVFGYAVEKAVQLMMQAHTSGRSVVWSGAKEVAELKVEQIQTFHEKRDGKDFGPLGCCIEPAA